MKKKLVLSLIAALLAVSVLAEAPSNKSGKFGEKESLILDTDTWIDINNILMFVTNKGSFAYDQGATLGKSDGLYYPFTSVQDITDHINQKTVIFASGIWMGAVDNGTGDTLVTVAEYSDDYFPGPIVGGTFVPGAGTASEYRVYKLYKDSLAANPNQDYIDWPVADGAPVDTLGNPQLIGDQMCWAVYNDINTAPHTNDASSDSGLGVEVRQTTFAYDRNDPLGEVVFIKVQIFNKGSRDLSEMFVSLWADPDLGDAGDDFDGCDTILSLGYCYNATNNDATYGTRPPAVGYDFFQGPLIFTGDNADTAKMWDTTFAGYLNMGMTSFNKYINGTDPASPTETYNYMNGLEKDGAPLIDPDGVTTKYFGAGDPVTGVGWLDVNASDRRYMLTTGPFNFAPGDSTEILAAIIVGQGGDRKSSVAVLKYNDKFAQQAYDFNFKLLQPPAPPVLTGVLLNGMVTIKWNDTSEVDPGDYPYQGYTVFQGESSTGPWTLVSNYDIDDGTAIILDEVLDPLTGVLEQRAVRFGSDNGVKRYYASTEDVIRSLPISNNTPYYYKVEAYSYNSDPLASPKTLSSAAVIRVTPQSPIAGTKYGSDFADTLAVTRVAGGSDGSVVPFIIDPGQLNGHDYWVIFDTDGILGPVWHLIDATTGDTLLFNQVNQSGDEDYAIVDGVMVKVLGPQFGVTGIQEVAGSGGPIVPPDNVMYSLNSTGDWYVDTDQPANFARMNWQNNIGTYDWEFRFTTDSSEYYDFNTDLLQSDRAPFEVWNIGIGTLTDTTDDVRIQFAIIDDDVSGAWSWGDRIYTWEQPYSEPHPGTAVYTFPDDFRIGRIIFQDNSGALIAPEIGTVVRFVTAKTNSVADTFMFTTTVPTVSSSGEQFLENIRAVPNPYYLSSSYDLNTTNRRMKFTNLPAKCTITIYNLAGHFVERIEKDDATTSETTWDLTNETNVPVASGIYIYVVEAPGFGQKIGKMAIFTEIEILGQY